MTNPPIHDRKARRAWADQHEPRCAFCRTRRAPWPGMAVHHLIKRSRSDEPCCLIWSCAACHAACHGLQSGFDGRPTISVAAQLGVKKETDPAEYDPERLAELLHESLPDLEPLPQWYLTERARNR